MVSCSESDSPLPGRRSRTVGWGGFAASAVDRSYTVVGCSLWPSRAQESAGLQYGDGSCPCLCGWLVS